MIAQMLRPVSRCLPRLPVQAAVTKAELELLCQDMPPEGAGADSCLQQAIWGKCNEIFMTGRCDKSCGRCTSSARTESLKKLLIVSARQAAPCSTVDGDAWVMRAQQNKAEYARVHGMTVSWTSAQVDPQAEPRSSEPIGQPVTITVQRVSGLLLNSGNSFLKAVQAS
jgi:hypothetical protein